MIIFTVTNKTTSQVYVGTTRNDLVDQWEKMVAAAGQNLTYPLYQEIRTHGQDSFTVEEWDYVDDRGELAALEQEALELFSAKSLRGYKTSTVKIQPKKKTRARKSSVEKELANIFAEAAAGAQDETQPPSLAVKSHTDTKPIARQPEPVTETRPKAQYSQAEIAELTKAVAEAQAKKKAPGEVAKKAAEIPDNCSQANAVVQMNHINLSDDITAQLAAIQATADAVLSGDTSSAANLTIPAPAPEAEAEAEAAEPVLATVVAIPEPEVKIEPVIELDPKQLRIRDAIERHRKLRAQKTTDTQTEERKQIAKMLTELNNRALELNSVSMAAVA